LTGPRAAGQSPIVMAALLSAGDAQRENERDERDARKVGKQSGGDGTVPFQAEIRCECAFTYMNAVFRKKLTDARAQECERRAHCARHTCRIRRCHRHRAVSPDDRDMHVGRERPLAGWAWGEEGGSQMGVAHAPVVSLLGCDSGADSDTGGTERRRRQTRGR
jgi:hypothetical protein